MKEEFGDLWHYFVDPKNICCITTNGMVKKDGSAVMGRGVALQAALRFPGLPFELGKLIQERGNELQQLSCGLIAFPVKHLFWQKASTYLIRRSASALAAIAQQPAYKNKFFILPRPGCGNGQLQWEEVRPLLLSLPDNVIVIDRKEKE